MSKTSGSASIWKLAASGSGMGADAVVSSDGKTKKEEADFVYDLYENDDDRLVSRKENAPKMVETFYDLVTDFYETGWGQAFHFASCGKNESFSQSIIRHEHYISAKLQLSKNDYVLDLGCGIGGPMRNIAQFSNSKIVGVTINGYQVLRGNKLNKENELDHLCKLVEMNFLDLKFPHNTFDKIFSIEATCHAGNRIDVFQQAYNVLKPGGLFATYEWVLTENYDHTNSEHNSAKRHIEKGNALPELVTYKQSIDAFKEAGFELVEAEDMAVVAKENNQKPWYHSLEAKCSLDSFYHSEIATYVTHMICYTMETIGFAPKGTVKTHSLLLEAKKGLVKAGRLEIFTPMYLLIGRKPAK